MCMWHVYVNVHLPMCVDVYALQVYMCVHVYVGTCPWVVQVQILEVTTVCLLLPPS